jgi:micrococcal nuclease
MKLRPVILAFMAAALILAAFTGITGMFSLKAEGHEARVERVIDGDTVVIAGGERVRLLGIDTPEKGQILYLEAKERLEGMVLGKSVLLEKDTENKDKYGRLLRNIFAGDVFVNRVLVEDGLARSLIIPPNEKHAYDIAAAEARAKKANLGVWKFAGLQEAFCIGIYSLHDDAKGADKENLNDEYVVFRNGCTHPVQMRSWRINDSDNNTFVFPLFLAENKTKFILHSGRGANNATDLYWGKNVPVWNNDEDTLLMWNANSELVLNYTY